MQSGECRVGSVGEGTWAIGWGHASGFGWAMKTQRREERRAAKPQPGASTMIFEPQIAQIARMGILFCAICAICGSISGPRPEVPERRRTGAQKGGALAG